MYVCMCVCMYVMYVCVYVCIYINNTKRSIVATGVIGVAYSWHNAVRSESRCAPMLRYVDLVVSIEVAV
jgi:pyrrolidone-carboxylate peptidase